VRGARRSGGGLVLLGMAFSVAAQQVGDPGAQELLRQQERERVLREQQESRPDVRLESSQGEQGERLPTQEQPCVRIDRIVLDGEGAKDFQWALAAADPREDPASGRCLGTEGINVVMKRVQNAIIARGYVTTRVLSAPQDLNTGTLTLSVVPGRFREGTLHNESIIQAGDRLTFTSGGNTTLQGAQLLADQVVGRVTGDLTLRSEQDTDRYKTEQLAAKGEATIGYGFEGSASGSASMIDSDYRSVREQTGIAAGSGGFQLQVGGNTHLAGAVIGSTADPSKNQLSTGSLSFEELKNRAEFLSASVSGGTSGGGNPSDGFSFDPSLVPGLPTGDSKSSTTRSGLADGTVEIRSGDDSALAGLQRGVTGLDNANGFAPIFDERKVQERQELTQMLGAIGFEVIGNLAANKTAQANADLEVARANGDAEAEADALRRIEQWGEGGRNKVLLHGLTGAAVAALSGGDIGGAAAGAAGSELAKDAMIRFLTGQGMDPRSAEFNSLIELASAALGGVVGGVDGAATALLGDQFNRQMHWDQYLDALDACKGNPGARGCSTILEMSENTNAVVISNSSDEVAYKVIANQNKDTGETVSFTLTEADGTPRIIMQRDEYNDFVMSAMPPPFWGMSPGYALDFGSYFSHGMRGKFGEAFGDISNIFTSGEYWRDMAISLITSSAGLKGNAGRVAGVGDEVAGSIRNVNPGFPVAGRTHNCVNCAIATDSLLAGNPASALPIYSTKGVSIRVIETQFGGRFGAPTTQQGLISQMAGAGNGARGIVYATYPSGPPGHVFNVVNQGGVVRFLDGQTGKVVDFSKFKDVHLMRTN